MKKAASILTAAVLLSTLIGCGGGESSSSDIPAVTDPTDSTAATVSTDATVSATETSAATSTQSASETTSYVRPTEQKTDTTGQRTTTSGKTANRSTATKTGTSSLPALYTWEEGLKYLRNAESGAYFPATFKTMRENGYIPEPYYQGKRIITDKTVYTLNLIGTAGYSLIWKTEEIDSTITVYYLDEKNCEEAASAPYRYSMGYQSHTDSEEKAIALGWKKADLVIDGTSVIAYYITHTKPAFYSTCCFVYDGYLMNISLYRTDAAQNIMNIVKDFSFVKVPLT